MTTTTKAKKVTSTLADVAPLKHAHVEPNSNKGIQ